jgi:hypothetical protein
VALPDSSSIGLDPDVALLDSSLKLGLDRSIDPDPDRSGSGCGFARFQFDPSRSGCGFTRF